MQKKALFICHAGSGIGLGHLSRSLVASRALVTNLGMSVDFVVSGEVDKNFFSSFPVNVTQTTQTIYEILEQVYKDSFKAVLCLDLFNQADKASIDTLLKKNSDKGTKIVALDNLPYGSPCIDLLYVPSFSAPNLKPDLPDFKVVSGWDCYLLNIQRNLSYNNYKNSVLILTGGSDPTELGTSWPSHLDKKLGKGIEVNWVTGPYAKRPNFPNHSNIKFIEHIAPRGLTSLMASATVASTVFGVSFFELIAMGIPTVVFSPYGNKDEAELSEIRRLELALVAKNENEASEKLSNLVFNRQKCEYLKSNCLSIMKDFTGKRFSDEIKELLKN